MRIETQRLLLRPYRAADAEAVYACFSDPAVVRFEPYEPITRAEAAKWAAERAQDEQFLAIALKETDWFIGNVYLGRRDFESVELGYVLAKAYQDCGYAREACAAAVDAAFEAGAHRVYAECNPENEASWRLLERLSFVREGLLRQNVFFRRDAEGLPVWQDTLVYARLR